MMLPFIKFSFILFDFSVWDDLELSWVSYDVTHRIDTTANTTCSITE